MKKYLNQLLQGQTLTETEAREALLAIGRGEINPAQMAAFLMGIQMKGITVDELSGFREAMLELAVRIDLSEFDPIDLCGTGGDGKDTFNISTTASFVVAGAGLKVAKHGNHGVSSSVGSSTVLEHLGVKFSNDPDHLRHKIETAGICYLHAPLFHPAMRHVGPIRKELGIKTFFNMLGPLLNPAGVKKQLTGVYDLAIFDLYHELFRRSVSRYGILHCKDGYDEISLTGDFRLAANGREEEYSPADIGLPMVLQEELHGGNSLQEAADILVSVLENKGTAAQTAAVVANAGVALGVANDLTYAEGIAMAKEALESGAGYTALKKLID